MFVGVDDNGKPVKGFTLGNESLQKWVNEIKNKTQPSIIPDAEAIDFEGINVGVLSVKEFPVKPAATFKEAQLIETVRYRRTASSPLKTSKADENYGSGIRRIREAFGQYGLKAPKFENFQHGFRVVVYAEAATEIDRNPGNTSGKILAYIRENPDITIPELSQLLEITERSIERNISQLQKDKKLSRIGPAKGGYWEVIGD